MYVDSKLLVQLSGVNSRGRPLDNIKVKCVLFIEGFLEDLW